MEVMHAVWRSAKRMRRIRLGPINFLFRFGRNHRRRIGLFTRAQPALSSAAHVNSEARFSQAPARTNGLAVIVGAGPGFGLTLARRLLQEGMNVALLARDEPRLMRFIAELPKEYAARAHFVGADATCEFELDRAFSFLRERFGAPELVVYALQCFHPGRALDIEVSAFEDAWRQNCLGAFIVAKQAAKEMLAARTGSLFFMGSTSARIGREDHLNLAVGKFGLRALAQVMARELWPHGIHVSHLLIDADIRETANFEPELPQALPEDIADTVLWLHRQPRSAWSSELDLRPYSERFWEHC